MGIPGTVYLILKNQGHNTIVFSNPCEFQERDSAFRRNQVKPPPQIAPGLSSVSFSNAMRYLLNDPPRSKLRCIYGLKFHSTKQASGNIARIRLNKDFL
jgi:hypothetical protein